MTRLDLASGSYPRLGASRGNDLTRERLQRYALPLCFFLFMCSISRVGPDFLPPTTNFSWALAYAILIAAAASRPSLYLTMGRRNAVFLVTALFATTSALWSPTPSFSFYNGILLFLNFLVGFVIADRIGIRRTIILIFWFCIIVQSASLFLLFLKVRSAVDYSGNFRGLYATKNVIAMHACLLYLTGLVLFTARWHRLISATGIILAVLNVILSRSGTGVLMFVLTTATVAACHIAASRRQWSLFLSGIFLVSTSAVIVVLLAYDYDVSSGVLNALGKDTTLTGRTILWEQAWKSFEEHPWFGLGYFSFWTSPETAAASIWIAMGQFLVSFHNVYLDRLVDVGAIGLTLFVACIMILLWRSGRRMLAQRSAIWAWCFAYVCFVTALGFSEYPIFWNSEYQLILSIIAAASCGVRTDAGAPRKAPSPTRVVKLE
jgi:exopolysaccharide production protein ExoQ